MPLILVVEQEKRYVERIEEALEPQGWEVVGVGDRSAAMRLVADRAADLVVVNSEVDESSELVSAFARANGGPGAVVLVPESDNGSVPPDSDEVLRKPFTDQDLRLAVRRCLSASRGAEAVEATPPASDVKFSSEDIFGDVVLELEGAFGLGDANDGAIAASESVEEEPVAEETAVEEASSEETGAEEAAAVEAVEEVEQEPAESLEIAGEVEGALEGLEAQVEEAPPEEARAQETQPAEAEALEEEVVSEEPADVEPVEEELAEVEEAADSEREAQAVDEETVEDLPVEEELVEEAEEAEELEELSVAEAEAEVEAEELEETDQAEEEAAVEPVPEKPKKKLLEERLSEALAEGKAMAKAEEQRPAASAGGSESVDLLLQKALATLSSETRAAARIDDEFAAPAHATAEEVDALVGTVVGKKKPVLEPPPAAEEAEAAENAPVEAVEEAASLDVMQSDLLDRDEGEYRTRMKILWLVILVVLAALVVFVLTRPSSDEPVGQTPAPASVDQGRDASSGSGEAVETAEGESAEPATDDNAEEDGEGADAPTS